MNVFRGMLLGLFCALTLTGCGTAPTPQEEAVEEPVLVEAAAAVLPDGTKVDRWRRERGYEDQWRLPDGTTLLYVNDPVGPEDVTVLGVGSIDELNDTARAAVGAYYEQMGLLYDVQEELEKAYEEYQSCQADGKAYAERWVLQDTTPSAFNDRIVCFLTVATLPLGDSECREERVGTVFDRETGEPIDNWSLFTVPPEEALARILDVEGVRDTQLRAEMQAALRPEYVLLGHDSVIIQFPPGSLPSQTLGYHLSPDYSDLEAVMQPWTLPDA